MNSKPVVSVIIPTKNEEKYLPRLLESIKKQTYKNYEVIVADGNSTDRTVEIAKKHGARVIDGKDHPGKGRNQGAKHAKGEILLFLDADTILPDEKWLEMVVREFEERGLGVATCKSRFYPDNPFNRFVSWFIDTYHWINKNITKKPTATGYCIIARKSVHKKIGGFDEGIRICEDFDYTERASKVARFDILPERILVAGRRWEKEGHLKSVIKYLIIGLKRMPVFRALLKGVYVEYEFGRY